MKWTVCATHNMDRNELQAQVACILVSLPLPPVPIQVCRGEDAVDGVCSSHDLHACMIATDMQRAVLGAVTETEQTQRMHRKACALNQMQTDITSILTTPSLIHNTAILQECYEIIGMTLRQYFSVYSHNCLDVRICPLDSVVVRDSVHANMLAYVKANLQLESGPDKDTSYTDLLKIWIQENFMNTK